MKHRGPSGSGPFVTDAHASIDDAIAALEARVAKLEGVPVPPPPPPPPPPAASTVICSGWMSTKDDWRIGIPNAGNLSVRFRKKGTGPIAAVAWQQRIGSGYSAGDGGLYRVSVQLSKSDGTPDGTILAVGTFTFNVNRQADAYFETWTLNAPTTPITDGSLVHIVFENIHASPGSNYISMNAGFMWGDAVGPQRQPAFPNTDLALLSNVGGGWGESNETPNFDVLPGHEGFGYTQCQIDMWKPVGGAAQVRERFLAPAKLIHALSVRVRRVSGSGALTILYETQAGALVCSGSVATIPTSTPGGDNGGQFLATATLPVPVQAAAGLMQLRLTAPSGTVIAVTPIRKAVRDNVKTQPDWGSYMSPSYAEYTSNGTSWASIYRSVEDQESIQFSVT